MQYLDDSKAPIVRENKKVIIERVLDRINKEHGKITPALLVETAKDSHCEIHKYFVWDNKIAGERYRLAQATSFILATRFVCYLKKAQKNEPINIADCQRVRKFLPYKEEGFKERAEVLSDADSRAAMVAKKKVALKSWCDSVVDIEELNGLRSMILAAL